MNGAKTHLNSKLMLDATLVEEELCGALQNAGHLAAADLERVLAIVNETGVPALKCRFPPWFVCRGDSL